MKRRDQLPEGKLLATTYGHNWGFILPSESGVYWEQQTNGLMCNHIYIEGVFIPLNKPRRFVWEKHPTENLRGKLKEMIPLLPELQRANYKYDYERAKELWVEIREEMHFNYEEIDAPEGQPRNQEGIQWIVLKEFQTGWGHGTEVLHLIGKTLCLVYPNCD